MTGRPVVTRAMPEHFGMIRLREIDQARSLLVDGSPLEAYIKFLQMGPGVSILVERGDGVHVVAIGGITRAPAQAWIGTAWMLTSPLVHDYPVCLLRACRDMVAYGHARLGFRRIQALVLDGYTRAMEFARAIGFEHEGVLRCFSPDHANMAIYSSVR